MELDEDVSMVCMEERRRSSAAGVSLVMVRPVLTVEICLFLAGGSKHGSARTVACRGLRETFENLRSCTSGIFNSHYRRLALLCTLGSDWTCKCLYLSEYSTSEAVR